MNEKWISDCDSSCIIAIYVIGYTEQTEEKYRYNLDLPGKSDHIWRVLVGFSKKKIPVFKIHVDYTNGLIRKNDRSTNVKGSI